MTRRRGRESGVALVVALLALLLVMTVAYEVFRLGARGAQSAAYGRDSVRASLVAEAGVAAAEVALKEDANNNSHDTLDEIWSRPAPPFDIGDGVVRVTAEDEERKINLNRVVMPNGNAPDERALAVFRRLLENLDVDPSLADALLDWLDNDEAPRVGGAESSYYLSLPYPYRSKNDVLDTVDELRLVRGFTPEVLAKILPHVTVHSSGRVNLNTAPKEILMSLAAGQDAADAGPVDDASAEAVIEYRKEKPFLKVEEVRNVSPRLADLFDRTQFRSLIDVRSTAFRVRSTGDVGGTVRTIEAVGTRSGNAIQWRYWRLE